MLGDLYYLTLVSPLGPDSLGWANVRDRQLVVCVLKTVLNPMFLDAKVPTTPVHAARFLDLDTWVRLTFRRQCTFPWHAYFEIATEEEINIDKAAPQQTLMTYDLGPPSPCCLKLALMPEAFSARVGFAGFTA